MPLLIDGYNLIHAANILGRGVGPGGLERAREALIQFVVHSLDENELRQSAIVFDASDAPPNLPREYRVQGLTIHFASQYEDADALLEELIRLESSPRRLTVVSSDHRVQRAARRRRAKAIDSDVWYEQMTQARRRRRESNASAGKPAPSEISESETAAWLREFGLVDSGEDDPAVRPEIDNPFPPGYGEDLLRDEEES